MSSSVKAKAKAAGTKKSSVTRGEPDASSQGSLEIGACCLCHCALDYSDRAAFFEADRHEDYHEDSDDEDYFFRPTDPYLPAELYDKHNALVYCDSCNRMYHQKCHFVPLTVLPRGDWHCLLCQSLQTGNKNDTAQQFLSEQLFQSPAIPQVRELEQQWEYTSRNLKATTWKTELRQRLLKTLQSQLANIRLAETALETLTSTQKNRSHFTHTSQEVAQLLVKLYGARMKLRDYLHNLHDIILSNETNWNSLLDSANDCCSTDFETRVLFPFGRQHTIRTDPRTPEMQLNDDKNTSIPTEIVLKDAKKSHHHHQHDHKKTKKQNDDDDSGISLDDLSCCVCHMSEATDENDLILCDGAGCYRAYHMKCIRPEVTAEELENENDDWFCPICQTLADHMLLIQTEYMGDDWEQRRYVAHWEGKETTGSLKSWDAVDEVFPEAPRDYEAACLLRDGKRTPATDQLLKRVLDLEELPENSDDDVDEDGHWDLDSYKEERRKLKEEMRDEDEESVTSSQATLVEMSSVELEIGKAELAALSEASDDDDEESNSDDESEDGVRRSRRLRKSITTSDNSDTDIGRLDEANIIAGKRGRKPVDYQKLNEAIFGDLSDGKVANIDDAEDFHVKKPKRDSSGSSDEDSSSDNSDDDSDDSSDSESQTEGAESSKRSRSRKAGSSEDDEGEEASAEAPSKPVAKGSKCSKSTKASNANIKRKNEASSVEEVDESEESISKPLAKGTKPKKVRKSSIKRNRKAVSRLVEEDGAEDNNSRPKAAKTTKTSKTNSTRKKRKASSDDDISEEAPAKTVAKASKEAKKKTSKQSTTSKRKADSFRAKEGSKKAASKPIAKASKEPKTKKTSDPSEKRSRKAGVTDNGQDESGATLSKRISKVSKVPQMTKASNAKNKRKRESDSNDKDFGLEEPLADPRAKGSKAKQTKKANKPGEPQPKKRRKQEDQSDASGQGEIEHAKEGAKSQRSGTTAKSSKGKKQAAPKNGKMTTKSKTTRKTVAKKVTECEPEDGSVSENESSSGSIQRMDESEDTAKEDSSRPSVAQVAIALVSKLVGVSPSKK